MPQEPNSKARFSLRPNSAQARSALTYILIITAALLMLNFYAAIKMHYMAFAAQESSMSAQLKLVGTALGSSEEFTPHQISHQISTMQDVQAEQILVTDRQGMVLYSKLEEDSSMAELTELARRALANLDIIACRIRENMVESRAAAPIYLGSELVGAVCLLQHDAEQGTMIQTLQDNILRISILAEALVIFFAFVFAITYSRRMRRILLSIRTVRKGDYTYRIATRGRDEVAQLAREFNDLTSRLQESEQRRRQFVSDASHELKTPLASIKLLTDTILQNEMDIETINEFVQDIGDEADRLNRLSRNLLELTKLDGHVEREQEIVSVAEVATRVVRMLTPIADHHLVTIETDLSPHCTVMTQEDDLYQILYNLTENGIKYNMPQGSLKLSCARAGDSVVITVADTGVGIPEEAMEHIFERFYRADKARSREAGGAGLGLSIVHDMVERSGGSIRADHRKPCGTVFTVTLPLFELEPEDGEGEDPPTR